MREPLELGHVDDLHLAPVHGDHAAFVRARRWYGRYGRWTLLLSWLPVVGDPLTLVAGVMRERLGVFVALVTLAKTGRYALLALVAGPAG